MNPSPPYNNSDFNFDYLHNLYRVPTPPAFIPSATSSPNIKFPTVPSEIPDPVVVFNYYVPVSTILTPAPSPLDNAAITDNDDNEEEEEKTLEDNDKTLENQKEVSNDLNVTSKLSNWCGSSIYTNMPDTCMLEFDRMLRESFNTKTEVIERLHNESPINYDYNPNKSRVRSNYEDPTIADTRTKNNVASRRSRQRKKFQQQVLQYSLDYDEDENFLLRKQEEWLRAIVEKLEEKVSERSEEVQELRKKCGFQQ